MVLQLVDGNSPAVLEPKLRSKYPEIPYITCRLGDNWFLVELLAAQRCRFLVMAELDLDGLKIQILLLSGRDIDTGEPMKHYWVHIHGLPRKF
jgi:hypothetical protein